MQFQPTFFQTRDKTSYNYRSDTTLYNNLGSAYASPMNLIQTDNMSWLANDASGNALLDIRNSEGNINTNSVEFSNVDLTEELVNLIGAQHDFQANAQVQQTYNQLLQVIENI